MIALFHHLDFKIYFIYFLNENRVFINIFTSELSLNEISVNKKRNEKINVIFFFQKYNAYN